VAHGLFQKIQGKSGEIRIETLGVLVASIASWTMTRRGNDVPGAGLYDFHAVFSYANPALWADEDYEKTITVKIGKDTFRLEQEEGFAAVIDGRKSLRMQGVKICQ
jgi:hypothetical protein